MSNIIEDYKKVDFKKSALALFMPDGKVISINKMKGYNYHMEYLKLLAKNYKEIKKVVTNIDLDYYLKNPSEIMTGVWPLFSISNISVFMNMSPNVYEPTDMGIILLSETLTKLTRNTLKNMDKQISDIIFMGIGHYIQDVGTYEIVENEDLSNKNSQDLFNVVDAKEEYTKNK